METARLVNMSEPSRTPTRIATVISLAVGIVSIMVFAYCSSYYASLDDPARIATLSYSLVMCLHLFVPMSVGVSSAVMAGRSSGRVISLTLMCVWLFTAIASLLTSVAYVRALIGFDIPFDYGVFVPVHVTDYKGMARVAITLVRPSGQALVAGLMVIGLFVGAMSSRRPIIQPRRRWREVAATLCGSGALLAFVYLANFLMFRVSRGHYGGIHAFCVMAVCLMMLPLFIASFNALLTRISVSVVPFLVWMAISVAAVALLAVTVTNLARERVFLRDAGAAIELHGMCAIMANRSLLGTASAALVLALAFFMARGALRGDRE